MNPAASATEKADSGDRTFVDRPVRVPIPVLVSFRSAALAIREFSLNLSEGGMFVPTDSMCEPGTQGTLKFRATQFDHPLTLQAEVVRIVRPGEETNGQACGLGIRFLDITATTLEKLREVVEGAPQESVVASIRKSVLENKRSIDHELRTRPTDQKMMLAVSANGREIDALIRDGAPTVLLRLLECPRLTQGQVITMMRSPKATTRLLTAIRAKGKFLTSAEARFLFCSHMNTNITEAMGQLQHLPAEHLRRMATNPKIKPQLRMRAQELGKKHGPRFARH